MDLSATFTDTTGNTIDVVKVDVSGDLLTEALGKLKSQANDFLTECIQQVNGDKELDEEFDAEEDEDEEEADEASGKPEKVPKLSTR